MKRLIHDRKSLIRSMQISSTNVFCFVEGVTNDRFFYDQLIRHNETLSKQNYEFKTAKEICDAHGGGKEVLLNWFNELDTSNKLITELGGKRTVIIIFLDKDIDDLEGNMLNSPNIIYTKYYDVENHIFAHGDIIKATAAATSLDMETVAKLLIDSNSWRRSAAERWKDWVALCIAMRIKKIHNACNYANCSKINTPINGPVCTTKLAEELEQLEVNSGLNKDQINQTLADARIIVNGFYVENNFDIIFKGKWYATILESDIAEHLKKVADTKGFGKKICSNLAQTIDYTQAWAVSLLSPALTLF